MEEIIDVSAEPVKINNKKTLKFIYIFSILNILAHTFLIKIPGNSAEYDKIEQLTQAVVTISISFPIISAILALVINLIPYKNFSYKERYSRTFTLIILALNIILTIGYILILIMTLTGQYPPKYS